MSATPSTHPPPGPAVPPIRTPETLQRAINGHQVTHDIASFDLTHTRHELHQLGCELHLGEPLHPTSLTPVMIVLVMRMSFLKRFMRNSKRSMERLDCARKTMLLEEQEAGENEGVEGSRAGGQVEGEVEGGRKERVGEVVGAQGAQARTVQD